MRVKVWMMGLLLALLVGPVAMAQPLVDEVEETTVQSEAPQADRLMDDSISVSLLTCSPGQEVYSLYGHTAIRCVVRRAGHDLDVVFNYGVFSFSQPHFIWRFVLGKCDYMVEASYFEGFLNAYARRGSRVTEQVLSLTPEEARSVLSYLMTNCAPGNNQYRYNFLYNNCTTMVRDVIERCVQGKVLYAPRTPQMTTRQILHQYTQGHPWAAEGDDLLLGSAVDTLASDRAAMFAPEYMMDYAAHAVVRDARGQERPLVAATHVLTPGVDVSVEPEFPLSPRQMGWGVLTFALLLMLVEWWRGRAFALWSVLLLLAQGLVGSLLLFMALCSEHPAVGSNWLLWPFCPLALVGIYFALRPEHRCAARWWMAYFCFLTLFLLFYPFIPQNFGNIVVPLTMSLLTRPIGFYLCSIRNRK